MKKEITFQIDEDLERKFNIALQIGNDDTEVILENLIKKYIQDILSRELGTSVTNTFTASNAKSANNRTAAYYKVLNRLPKWANSPHQINHRILKAFFATENEKGFSYKNDMARFINEKKYQINPWQFETNLISMCTEEGNSHGEAFACKGDKVFLSEIAKDLALAYREKFLES